MSKTFHSAEIVKTAEGRQYHIGIAPGEIAPYILMCGDPARVHKIAAYFETKNAPIAHRDYVTITGKYKGMPLSVMATGMGPDNTEIALVEISQVVKNPTLIRVGTSGGLLKEAGLGDLLISTGAVRLENTSTFFVHEGYPAIAHYEVVQALITAARQKKIAHHVGLTATAPGFYGAQGRKVPGFMPRDPELPDKLAAQGVANFEMESSALFILSTLAGFRAGTVCSMINNRHKNIFIDAEGMQQSEQRCIETGLEAMVILAQQDKGK